MPDTFYALTKIDCTMRDDGTRAQFSLTLAQAGPARFYVNPEGLGSLIQSLKFAAVDMAKRLQASGAGAKYNAGKFENAADRVLSFALGTEEPAQELTIAIQTDGGVLSRYVIPTDVALRLADEILQMRPQLNPGSSSPVKH